MARKSPYNQISTRAPSTVAEPILGRSDMVRNNDGGGFVFGLDPLARATRFIVLGSDSATYYQSAAKLTRENAEVIITLAQSDRAGELVDLIVAISEAGRAKSNDPALFALAICGALGSPETKRRVFGHRSDGVFTPGALHKVARIGTHLFHFVEYAQQFRGWGRGLRTGVADWFNERPAAAVAYQAVKYRSRDGWAQRDLLRQAHPRPLTEDHGLVYRWIADRLEAPTEKDRPAVKVAADLLQTVISDRPALRIIDGYERAQKLVHPADTDALARLIVDYNLPREALPTDFLKEAKIWEALLPTMPLGALIRNLANMTRSGLLKPMSDAARTVVEKILNADALHKARIHPLGILAALLTYKNGVNRRGDTYQPVGTVIDALDEAFYLAFENVVPTNKRLLLALDVSSSMGGGEVGGVPGLTPAMATGALALVTARTEPNYMIMGFANEFRALNITPRQRLDDVMKVISGLSFGGTDIGLPMLWAIKQELDIDAFLIYTDNEVNTGSHPSQNLVKYRLARGIPARMVVTGLTSTGFSVADPNDGGMLDCVGFDAGAPAFVSDFVANRLGAAVPSATVTEDESEG